MIVEALLRLLLAIHKQEPIKGNILTLGKQTIGIPKERILQIFKEQGVEVNPNFDMAQAEKDQSTRCRRDFSIDDASLYKMLGDDIHYHAMDVSDYENASMIHNLNDPIPKEWENKFDFIIDGSTFDHLVDLKTALANVVKLLKPGGRVFQCNTASNYANAGYLCFSADYFYDYYTLNKFADCRTYFGESYSTIGQNWLLHEFKYPDPKEKGYNIFRLSPFYTMVFVIARKGEDSTFDKIPTQICYRNKKDYPLYEQKLLAQPLPIRTISVKQTDFPMICRLKMKLLRKPCKESYEYVGWV